MIWFWVGLLVGSMLVPFGIILDRRWRYHVPRSEQWIIRRIYRHVDDLLGATETEKQDRADRIRQIVQPRFKGWRRIWYIAYLIPKKVREAFAYYHDPIPRIGQGTNPLPLVERMAVYVQVSFDRSPTRRLRLGPNLYQLWNVAAVTLTWTSEANALGEGYPRNLGRKVAQALRLEGADQLDIDVDHDEGRIRYARKGPAPEFQPTVPVGVNADA